MWRRALRRVAVVALAASVLFAGILAASPTARAVVSRWVAEWYESHVTYQYSGRQTAGEMPQYEIGDMWRMRADGLNCRGMSVRFIGIRKRAHGLYLITCICSRVVPVTLSRKIPALFQSR